MVSVLTKLAMSFFLSGMCIIFMGCFAGLIGFEVAATIAAVYIGTPIAGVGAVLGMMSIIREVWKM